MRLAQCGAHLGQGFLRCLGVVEILIGIHFTDVLFDLSDGGVVDGENYHHVFECLLLVVHRSRFCIFGIHYFLAYIIWLCVDKCVVYGAWIQKTSSST